MANWAHLKSSSILMPQEASLALTFITRELIPLPAIPNDATAESVWEEMKEVQYRLVDLIGQDLTRLIQLRSIHIHLKKGNTE